MEIYLEPLLPVARCCTSSGPRRPPRRSRRSRPRSASSSTAPPRAPPGRRHGRGDLQPRRRRGRRDPGGARRRRRLRRRGLQPHPRRGAARRARPHRRRARPACTPTSGSTSARAPRRRSRCRSWPRSCAASGSRDSRRPAGRERRRPPVAGRRPGLRDDRHHRPRHRRTRSSTAPTTGSACPGCRDQLPGGRTPRDASPAVVLAAGASRRLGSAQAAARLPTARPLLDATLSTARQAGARPGRRGARRRRRRRCRSAVDLTGVDVVLEPGLRRRLRHLDPVGARRTCATTRTGSCCCSATSRGVTRRDHPRARSPAPAATPSASARTTTGSATRCGSIGSMFDDPRGLHGDKAVWKLVDAGRATSSGSAVAGPVPRDVDTWDDYEALLAESAG